MGRVPESSLLTFVREIAQLKKEGEGAYDDDDGFVWEPDDAFETLEGFISQAREILSEVE